MGKIREKYIGDKAFYLMLMSVAVPIMVQNGITNFVSLLDNIMVGRIGTEPMSADHIRLLPVPVWRIIRRRDFYCPVLRIQR